MEIKEAYNLVSILPEEIESVQRYLGFYHTRINILSNLDSNIYHNLSSDNWLLPETEEEVNELINDFVNIYSVMYKESYGKNLKENLVRGTNNNCANDLSSITSQFLSTSTDEEIAKRFCEYGNAALIHFSVEKDVPFLDAEKYRGEYMNNEKEVIIAPFCKATKKEVSSSYTDYTHYYISLEKPSFEIKTDAEIKELFSQVNSGFSQNIADMKEYVELDDNLKYLKEKLNNITDKDEIDYIAEKINSSYKKCSILKEKTDNFKITLQNLLKGLCGQKEQEINQARGIVEQDKEIKSEHIDILDTNINKVYQDLLSKENTYINFAQSLGIELNPMIPMNIKKDIALINQNITYLKSNLNNIMIPKNIPIDNTKKSLNELLDGVDLSIELTKDFPSISALYKTQCENDIKKSLYFKLQYAIQNAKVQKYMQEKQKLEKKKIGLIGIATGKDKLKSEELENIALKIKLEQIPPKEQEEYSIKEMLADAYCQTMLDFNGDMPKEVKEIYTTIRENFKDSKYGKFSDEYIAQLGMNKMNQMSQDNKHNNLPAVLSKKPHFSRKNKVKIDALRIENSKLQYEIVKKEHQQAKSLLCQDSEPSALLLFEQKLQSIITLTSEKPQSIKKKDYIQTAELW